MSDDLSLNPVDVHNAVKAVRLAQSRGAFAMEETAQLVGSVQRLESWVEAIKHAQEESDKERKAKKVANQS